MCTIHIAPKRGRKIPHLRRQGRCEHPQRLQPSLAVESGGHGRLDIKIKNMGKILLLSPAKHICSGDFLGICIPVLLLGLCAYTRASMGLLIEEVEKKKKELGATGNGRSPSKELLVLL